MKSIFIRVHIYILNKKRYSFFLCFISFFLGFVLGLSVCYMSVENLYMDAINRLYPAKIWMILKDSSSGIAVDFDIQEFVRLNEAVAQVTVDTLDHKEIVLVSHDMMQRTLEEFNSKMEDNSPFVFVNATDFLFKQLVQTLEIQSGLQKAMIAGIVYSTALFFIAINIASIRQFNKDASILLRIGETKHNVAIQYICYDTVVSLVPMVISMCISLNFYDSISNFWINTSIADSVIFNFSAQRAALCLLENSEIIWYVKISFFSCFLFDCVMVFFHYFYYRKIVTIQNP